MELKVKDTYKVSSGENLSEDALTSLMSLYQPLVGRDGILLYLTLHAEGRMQRSQDSHTRLCQLMNLSIDDIERARIHLEEFLLIRTYVQHKDDKTAWIYVLNAPLPVSAFLASRQYMQMYTRAVGSKTAELTISKLSSGSVSTSGYEDATHPVIHVQSERDYDNTVSYNTVKPTYKYDQKNDPINFDYEHFLATTSLLVFPAELRSQENLKLIGRLATVNGLSADRMRELVCSCVRLDSMTFDDEKLKYLASTSRPDITNAKDPYALPPVSFLMAKQNGAQVSLADRKILEHLSIDMHFSNEVINIMIEYILKKSQNRLVKAFVDMVAGEWSRDHVTTREEAIAETRKKNTSQNYQKEEVLPAYYDKKQKNDDADRYKPLSHEELENMRRKLKEMEKQNGAR